MLLAACVVAIINISARPVSKNQAQRKETWKAHRKLRERRGDDGLRSVWLGGRAPRFRLGVGVEDRGGKNSIAWHFRKQRTLAGRICSLVETSFFRVDLFEAIGPTSARRIDS